MEHIIVKNIVPFKRKKLQDPDGYEFDTVRGAWTSIGDGSFLIKSPGPTRPQTGTKKNDVETGEDLKGQ